MAKMKCSAGEESSQYSRGRGNSDVFLLLADDAINSNWAVDVLDPPFSQALEREARMPEQLLANGLGNIYPARFRQSFEPRRDIDAVAVNVVFIDDDIARIDPDAQFELTVTVGGRVGQAALDLDSAAHRVDGTVELHEEPVALAAGEPAPISGDRRFDQMLDAIAKADVRTLLVDAHQAAVPDHIREQDRCQPPC
jgi:hypothetical protein